MKELLEKIYAEPERDEARLVYADWLLENGDSRGEFISLSFEKSRRALNEDEQRRYVDLIRQNEKAWIGAICDATTPETRVYSRGFLSSCMIRKRMSKLAIGHPAWATVHSMQLATTGAGMSFALHPVMSRSLKTLAGVDASAFTLLTQHSAPLAIESLVIGYGFVPIPDFARAYIEATTLPKLTTLIVQGIGRPDQLRPFVDVDGMPEKMQALDVFGTFGLFGEIEAWMKTLNSINFTPRTMRVGAVGLAVPLAYGQESSKRYIDLSRGADGRWSQLSVRVDPPDWSADVVEVLKHLSTTALTKLSITGIPPEARDVYKAVAHRQKRLVEPFSCT